MKTAGLSVSRRSFLRATAWAWAGIQIVPRRVLGAPDAPAPSNSIRLAAVGIGGVGHSQVRHCVEAGFSIAALCDIDEDYAGRTHAQYPGARRYRDFREMLDAEGDRIDAVYCGTPDHTHAVISLAALRKKKHVLTVKPLTRTVREARVLAAAAREAGVMTQMTASSAATETGCRTCEFLQAGLIGDVTQVHIWSDRPIWPQGMVRPPGSVPVPKSFDWDLWLGPAPKRPYVDRWPDEFVGVLGRGASHGRPNVYHPFNFRGWHDFGTGALGDMGCHHFNTPRRALKLGAPVAVSATSTRTMDETWPLGSIVTWDFPAREGLAPVRVTWYDGGIKPPRPPELEPDRQLPAMGILYVGTKGSLLGDGTDSVPRLIPEARMKAAALPGKTLPRSKDLYREWIDAIQGGPAPSEHWPDSGAPLTELVLLGNAALRVPGKRLAWDPAAMRFPNCPEATKLLTPEYQNGWTL